ncbi:hypothetical protein OG900_33020 [Streptomyces sp. NBC_00433]
MADTTFPPDLVDLQRRAHEAWAAVEAHRKQVDARRVAEADAADEALRAAGQRVSEVPTWGRRTLPPWTEADDQEHARLMGEVTAAAEALRVGVAGAGLDGGYDAAQGLHTAARA